MEGKGKEKEKNGKGNVTRIQKWKVKGKKRGNEGEEKEEKIMEGN